MYTVKTKNKKQKTTLIQFCVSNVIPVVLSKKGLCKKHILNTNGILTVLQPKQKKQTKKIEQNFVIIILFLFSLNALAI